MRFQQQLDTHPAAPEEQKRLRIFLGESLVRAKQPEQAIAVLHHESLSDSVIALFWKAQAWQIAGEIQKAIGLLDQVIAAENSMFEAEAILTRARLQTRLGAYRDAIAGLNLLTTTKSALANRAKLDQTRLFLQTGKIEDARKTLPSPETLRGTEKRDAQLLHASLLHAESSFSQAAQAFQSLLAQYQKDGEALPVAIHPAAIGYARALASLQQRTEATDSLLSFVQNQPSSPLLDEAFDLLRPLLLNRTGEEDPVASLIMDRLIQWSVASPILPYSIMADSSAGAADRIPAFSTLSHPELHAQALFLRILALGQSSDAESAEAQRRLVSQMRWDHPNHPLAQRAIIEQARTLYRLDRPESARELLQNLLQTPAHSSPEVEALLLLAKNLFAQQDFTAAAEAFEKAAQTLTAVSKTTARFNAGISYLLAGDFDELRRLQDESTPSLRANLELEHALFSAKQQPQIALPLLDRFLVEHPKHPRILEARLAMAFCAMEQIPPQTSVARALLDTLKEEKNHADQIVLANIQWFATTQNHTQTIALCQQFLESYPESPQIAKVTLLLGSALYQNGDLNDARQTLQKLENTHPEQSAPALLIAARAAARTGTPQSLAESIELFDKIIQSASPLAPFAALEKARTLIDTKSSAALQQAITELQNLDPKLEKNPLLRITAGLLWMESLYALGGSEPSRHEQGLQLQKQLLERKDLTDDDRNRIYYFRGLTLEQLQRADEALEIYYKVIEAATQTHPHQWDFFERCGFNAVALLEKNQRWESAVALAKQLSAFPSPRAKEAAERAERLSLEHMILDESANSQ